MLFSTMIDGRPTKRSLLSSNSSTRGLKVVLLFVLVASGEDVKPVDATTSLAPARH